MAIEIKDTEIFPYRKINDELDKNAVEYEHQSRFMIDFNFGGSVWCVDIWAKDWDEAKLKCSALKETAHVSGEIVGTIPYGN